MPAAADIFGHSLVPKNLEQINFFSPVIVKPKAGGGVFLFFFSSAIVYLSNTQRARPGLTSSLCSTKPLVKGVSP